MTESRLQRWARKKAETKQGTQPAAEAPSQPVEARPETSPIEQELAANQQLPEKEILAKYSLPDPDTLEQGTDITGFLRKEIPEFLRRKALRSLWRSNPVFSVLDGLNEYDEDFSKASIPIGGVKTAYKVGKGGFLDLEKRERERQESSLAEPPADNTVRVSAAEPGATAAQDVRLQEPEEEKTAPEPVEVAVDNAKPEPEAQPQISEPGADTETRPRFRPRMQFES
ncbi:DUF3306 domain-containing protein [Marinobacter sp. CHS3-4]|uniref:DUF3306 domain-containing protein n=1 Tax=Marinobacter sp. CHS3-4 TaxID=3045174 RepID=UPI0024B485D1|nr:DUF3306 domain-containing protein [Marinobacter sp. CHS3-4]MDI9246410.1 DUF3306 domain-containing protein [Marinobacter sp. CHS3-4]